jgi:hypothetical protein
MNSDQNPEASQAPADADFADRSPGDGPRLPDGREDNRHFRRQRHRDCYCRGRNKNCPKCQGTGQLLPNWRENLHAARTGQRPQPAPTSAYASPAPAAAPQPVSRDYAPPQQPAYDRNDRPERQERNYDRNDRPDRNDRNNRRDRWQNRGGSRNQGGFNQNRNQRSTVKMCPMCGEYVPNLRAHVLARHDD